MFARNVHRRLLDVENGDGVYLYTTDGRRYLDGCAGALVANIGHGVGSVADAIADQARRLAYAHQSRATTEPVRRLARMVAALAPGDLNHVIFVSGGSEATEAAIKLARQYYVERDGKNTSKHLIIGRWHGFHGVTLGALAAGGNVPRRAPFVPMLAPFEHVDPPYCYRCPFDLSHPSCGLRCAHQLEEVIQRVGPEHVAAFICEPIIGATAGAVVPPDDYLPMIRAICDRYDVLLIADEVMTGFGRTGATFAVDHWGVIPDLLCLAKGMSAGYAPLGAVVVSDRIYEVFADGSGSFVHGHTYGGHPVSCAAGAAILNFIEQNDLLQVAATRGEYLQRRLRGLEAIPIVGDVRGRGLMAGVELVQDRQTKQPFPSNWHVGEQVTERCLERGLIVYPGGGMALGRQGDQLLIGPPFVITEPQIDELVGALESALWSLSNSFLGERGSS